MFKKQQAIRNWHVTKQPIKNDNTNKDPINPNS